MLICNFGESYDHQNFYKALFREYLEDAKAIGFLSQELSNYSSCLPFRDVQEALDIQIYASHFSVALYFYKRSSRLKENIRYLIGIPLDIDWGKKGNKKTKAEVWHWIKENLDLEVSFLWNSKSEFCYHGMILIEMMVGTPESIHLFEWVAKEIAMKVNADLGATNSNQWLRKPLASSFYGALRFSNKIYNINELKRFLPTEKELAERREKFGKDGVVNLRQYQIENHPAIKALLGGEIISWRNHACFTAALAYKVLGYSPDEALDKLSGEWLQKVNNPNFDHAFTYKQVRDCVKSAYKDKYRAPSKEWIYNVTGIEFPWNIGYVRSINKTYDEKTTAILQFIKENNGITITTQDLADNTGLSLDMIKKMLPSLRKKRLLEYETTRGRYSKGSTIFLGPEAKFFGQDNVVVEVDFGYKELEPICM